MTKRLLATAWIVAIALLIAQSVTWAQAPQGIVVVPPSPQIQASISVDRAVYQPGERILIHYSVSTQAYVYIIDIDAQGRVTQIFPNRFSQNNFVPAGNRTLPDNASYSFVVTPPAGTELVQIIATLTPIDLGVQGFVQAFPSLGNDPSQFQANAQAAIQGIVPTGEVATAFTQFQVGGAPSNTTPVARFTVSPNSPNVGQAVTFDASGSFDPDGFISSYEWDFNSDGFADASGIRVSRTFFSAGPASVRLTVRDNAGQSASTSQLIQVGRAAQPPTAAFSFSPPSPNVGESVLFDGSASFDPDGFIANYQWDLNGDGAIDASGVRVSARYNNAGTARVTLTVQDNQGLTSSTTQTFQVGRAVQPPTAAFSFSPLAPQVGQAVTFDASGSFDPDGFVSSYEWDFNGDGFTDAAGVRVSKAFFSPGQQRVTLRILDNSGLSATATQFVQVGSSSPDVAGYFVDGPSPNLLRIRVQGQNDWFFQNRAFRILLETDGVFTSVQQQGTGNAAPQGISPVPNQSTLEFNGFVGNGSVTFLVGVSNNATKVKLDLRLDTNGDGVLERQRSNVFLGAGLVNPPSNPFVLSFSSGNLVFDATLKLCLVLVDQPGIQFSICFRFNTTV